MDVAEILNNTVVHEVNPLLSRLKIPPLDFGRVTLDTVREVMARSEGIPLVHSCGPVALTQLDPDVRRCAASEALSEAQLVLSPFGRLTVRLEKLDGVWDVDARGLEDHFLVPQLRHALSTALKLSEPAGNTSH